MRSALEKKLLPKLRSLEAILQPINRLPKDIFTLIPRFFTREDWDCDPFPMNPPLITMTHVCRSWRTVLLSTPGLWTQIDFSVSESKQAKCFMGRCEGEFLDVYQAITSADDEEPFLSTTLHNMHRLRRLEISSLHQDLERVLTRFTRSAPELKHLEIGNDSGTTFRDMKFHDTIFEGQLPKLHTLSLHSLHTDLRGFTFPSLKRFNFSTGTETSVRDLTSFFELCPLLEFIQIRLYYMPHLPMPPPKNRIRLPELKELRLDQTASTCGLLDHLILPKCAEMMLQGQFTGEKIDNYGHPAAQIHPSSIDHIPATRGITKAVAMPNSCILSGPGGNLRFRCLLENRASFNAKFFTSFSPISTSEIRELWVGAHAEFGSDIWGQTAARVRGAFGVLPKVEDLTIVNCETGPFFTALGGTTNGPILLPELRGLTIYARCGDLDVSGLIRCAEARLERSRSLGEVTIILDTKPEANMMREMEPIGRLVSRINIGVGAAPELRWEKQYSEVW